MHVLFVQVLPSGARSALHGAAFDIEEAREIAGLLCRLHFLLGAAAAEERVELALRKAFVGLLDSLVHGSEGGARGGGEAEAEPGDGPPKDRALGELDPRHRGGRQRQEGAPCHAEQDHEEERADVQRLLDPRDGRQEQRGGPRPTRSYHLANTYDERTTTVSEVLWKVLSEVDGSRTLRQLLPLQSGETGDYPIREELRALWGSRQIILEP